jgi:hypothetical protein
MQDLIVLASCNNCKFTIQAIIETPARLGIRPISVKYLVHPNKDPGCLLQSDGLLRAQAELYSRALVVFDRDGCGQNARTCNDLEAIVEGTLSNNGWSGRCGVVVISPELDIWVWSDSNEVDRALGWFGKIPSLRSWLRDDGHWIDGEDKPRHPKEALEQALRIAKTRRTSAIYDRLARTVSFQRCTDRSFLRFKQIMQQWFGD